MASSRQKNSKLSVLEIVLHLQGLLRQRLQPLHVSPMQAGILLYLDRHPRCKLIEVASTLRIQQPSMVETIQLVQRKGWVHKARTTQNRRIVKLRLTTQGNALAQEIKETLRNFDGL